MTEVRMVCLATVVAIVAGCAGTGSAPTFMPPVGSTVDVTQDLQARSGARLYIQDGRAMPRGDVKVQRPYCQFFLIRSQSEMGTSFVIRTEVFTVTRTYRQRDMAWAMGLQFAGLGSNATLTTIMELSSDTQPEVRELRCMRWGTINMDGYLTIAEMQTTLGGLVKLGIKG